MFHLSRRLVPLLFLLACPLRSSADLILTLTGGPVEARWVPVCVPLTLSTEEAQAVQVTLVPLGVADKKTLLGQLTAPGLETEAVSAPARQVRRDLHFLLPYLPARTRQQWQVHFRTASQTSHFAWQDQPGRFTDLLWYSDPSAPPRPVMRYMYRKYDNSTPQARNQTYKVFHHLFAPSGRRLVTNGGYADETIPDPKKLLYPHHRGLMYAFNRITYGKGQHADTWHAQPKDTHQEHLRFLSSEAGAVLGRHRVLVGWYGPQNDLFAQEEREVTVYAVPGGTLVEFASRLRPLQGAVQLDGDPQHAGFQFRAANAVAEKTEKQTYFLRPDGPGQPGETRNWDPKTRKGPANLPWDAMSFVLDGQRYTVAYLNHPANPGEQRYSERAYGRIGCYFTATVTAKQPLVVRYRLWLQEGEMTVSQVQTLYQAFTAPPQVAVRRD